MVNTLNHDLAEERSRHFKYRMGYGLYFENMLASVIVARDRYLRTDGLMMPNRSQLFIQAMDPNIHTADSSPAINSPKITSDDAICWWQDFYGFDMSDMIPLIASDAQVQEIKAYHIISNRPLIHQLDLQIANDADLDFTVPFRLVS